MIPGIAQSPAIHRLFKALDQNNDNKLDFREMICGLSILAKGTLDEKLELLFKSFDVDNTGFITQTQLEALITSVSSQLDPEHPDKHSSMGSGVVGTDPLGVRVVSVSTFVEQVFAHLCITTGRLSLDQFRQAVIAEPRLIECLMVGLDQEDIAINITPVEVTPEPSWKSHPYANLSNSNNNNNNNNSNTNTSAYAPTTTSTTITTTITTPGDPTDQELALAVTDADNQTPLLGGDEHASVLIDKGQCCILL